MIGSIPFAYLIVRIQGKNIFAVGTKNPGSSNTFREIGKISGASVFLLDATKAIASILIAQSINESQWFLIFCGLSCMIGHWYPIFLKFRGGMGLACIIGMAIALMPIQALIASIPTLIVLWLIRSVGHATAVGFSIFFCICLYHGYDWNYSLAVSCIPILCLARERLLPSIRAKIDN
jgi:glycerol-3-phosphate acyltransferase PlsY